MKASSSASLLRRQPDLYATAPDATLGRVEPQRADLEHGGPLDRAAPRDRSESRVQLGERERLRQVVVAAAVESRDTVRDGIPGSEEKHRCLHVLRAKAPADLEAVRPGRPTSRTIAS